MNIDVNKPAKFLSGKTLEDGWVVKENITKTYDHNVTSFAETYIVQKGDEVAILKALDFSIALLDNNPTSALVQLSKSYDFEKELLELCKSNRFTRIIRILAQGNLAPLPHGIIPVPYFILEYAEKDVRSLINLDSRFNIAWLLRVLHNVSIGLWQLHKQGIAHKNIKPEFIMEFSKRLQKITELGGSDKKGIDNPNKNFLLTGDPSYLTPEYLYGQIETDWVFKSQASDIYQLGNLVFFLFTQSNFNTWLFYGLDDLNSNYRPEKWGGTFNEVLPYLEVAYDWAIVNFFKSYTDLEGKTKDDLEIVLRQLCHPDPKRRGHPKNIASITSSMSVERYISIFNRLAYDAEIIVLKKK